MFKIGDIVEATEDSSGRTIKRGTLWVVIDTANSESYVKIQCLRTKRKDSWATRCLKLVEDFTDIEKALYGVEDV